MNENPPADAPLVQAKNALHGITLEAVLTQLVTQLGWEELGRRIDIKCFKHDPGIKSSLTFLRKTPWARSKVEELFLALKGRD
ncbi:VF530 family protein [soil metagenome]